uniref:translation initiation factor IF-2-like n=1 Tax=Nyctereutes procyonoides TaxID=34880 RepID=UPI002444A8D4|nr:translation initiation factor IF-2-like [Nyctereutes procyonoides]
MSRSRPQREAGAKPLSNPGVAYSVHFRDGNTEAQRASGTVPPTPSRGRLQPGTERTCREGCSPAPPRPAEGGTCGAARGGRGWPRGAGRGGAAARGALTSPGPRPRPAAAAAAERASERASERAPPPPPPGRERSARGHGLGPRGGGHAAEAAAHCQEGESKRERGRDTGRGRNRLHAPGTRRGIRSRVSRIAPRAKGEADHGGGRHTEVCPRGQQPHHLLLCGCGGLRPARAAAAGFLRYNKIGALFTKVDKNCPPAKELSHEVQDLEGLIESTRNQIQGLQDNVRKLPKLPSLSPLAIKHLWIRTALFEKVLDKIVHYLVENSRCQRGELFL